MAFAGDPLRAPGDADRVLGRRAETGHRAGRVCSVAVTVVRELGVPAQNVEPALLPRMLTLVAAPAVLQCGVVPVHAGVEAADQTAGAVEAELVPDLRSADGAQAGGDADAARSVARARLPVDPWNFHADGGDELRREVRLDQLYVRPLRDLGDRLFCAADDHQIRNPVAGVSQDAAGAHGRIQVGHQGSLTAGRGLQCFEHPSMTFRSGRLGGVQFRVESGHRRLIGHVDDDTEYCAGALAVHLGLQPRCDRAGRGHGNGGANGEDRRGPPKESHSRFLLPRGSATRTLGCAGFAPADVDREGPRFGQGITRAVVVVQGARQTRLMDCIIFGPK